MEVIINGEPRQLPDRLNAAGLIEHLGLSGKRLAMEVNLEIVPRSQLNELELKAGDRIEIVHAIGGG